MDIISIIFLMILCGLIYILFQGLKQQTKNRPKLDHSLDQKVLSMLGGDKKVALRLLRSVRKHHPGRSYLWYHEKVIRDLERDRRCDSFSLNLLR